MSIQGIQFCDLCGGPIVDDDLAPIKIEQEGHLRQMHFHNRNHHDCLAQKLTELSEQFESESLVPAGA